MSAAEPKRAPLPRLIIGGIPVVRLDRAGLAQEMVADWQGQGAADRQLPPRLVFSANGQGLSIYARDAGFRALIDAADIVHADGQSLVFASRLRSPLPLPERIATTDFFHDAARAAQDAGMAFYFLGGSEAVNRKAVERVQERYPKLRIAGRRHGYFEPQDIAGLLTEIQAAGTDVLWLALGRPKQEEFAVTHRDALAGITWIKTCGGLFDFLAGAAPRAPVWMQAAGLEWLFRMSREPRRLGPRYLLTTPHAIWRMLVATSGKRPPDI